MASGNSGDRRVCDLPYSDLPDRASSEEPLLPMLIAIKGCVSLPAITWGLDGRDPCLWRGTGGGRLGIAVQGRHHLDPVDAVRPRHDNSGRHCVQCRPTSFHPDGQIVTGWGIPWALKAKIVYHNYLDSVFFTIGICGNYQSSDNECLDEIQNQAYAAMPKVRSMQRARAAWRRVPALAATRRSVTPLPAPARLRGL